MKMQDRADWHSSEPFKAREDETDASVPPLSRQDANRLLREWADANMRGDVEARRLVEDEILGRPSPRNAPDAHDG